MIEIAGTVGDVLDTRYHTLATVLRQYVKDRAAQLETVHSHTALRDLDLEIVNIASILDTFLVSDMAESGRNIFGVFLGAGQYLSLRGLWHDKLRWGLFLLEHVHPIDPYNLAGLFNNLGTTYDDLSDYETALHYYEMSLAILPNAGTDHPAFLAQALSNMAVTYWRLGQIDTALEYARRALEMERQQNNRHAQAMSLMNLSGIFYTQWDMAESLKLAQEALAMARETGDVALQAQFTSSLATVMVANLLFDEAAPIYEEALQLLTTLGDEIGLARAEYNYGLLCRLLRLPERVRQLAQHSLAVFERYRLPEAQPARDLLAKPCLSEDGASFTA